MKVKFLNTNQIAAQLKRLITQEYEFYWAVAWATETELSDVLIANKKKIRELVIGTDFAQTSPVLLRKLKSIKNVRIKISLWPIAVIMIGIISNPDLYHKEPRDLEFSGLHS